MWGGEVPGGWGGEGRYRAGVEVPVGWRKGLGRGWDTDR